MVAIMKKVVYLQTVRKDAGVVELARLESE